MTEYQFSMPRHERGSVARGIARMVTLRLAFVVMLGIFATSCKDEQREAERKREESAQSERAAKRQAERDQEARLMMDPATAKVAIEQRIASWLTKRGAMLFLAHEKTQYAVPTTVPWFGKCEQGEVTVTLGPWTSGNGEASYPLIEHHLTSARVPPEQCNVILEAISNTMLALLSK